MTHEGRSDFDALADLFLGDGAMSATGTTDHRAPSAAPAATPSSSPAPSLRLARVAEASEPLGTTPQPPRAEPVTPAAAPGLVPIEAVLVGHLPVMGGVWVTQYAKHVADRDHRVVALLRVQAGQASIDVFTPRSASTPTSSRIGEMRSTGLDEALRDARARAEAWLVRVDEASEADLIGAPAVTGLTLLTGADDPAVVASYRTIKSLQQAESSREEPLPVGIAIMGSDDDRAAAAEAKLQRAAANFLGRSLSSAARIAKVGACTTTNLYRGDLPGESSSPHFIADLIASLGASQPRVTQAHARHAPASPAASPTPPAIEHKPAGAPAPLPARADVDSLAGMIQGLEPLGFRCPYAPNVELAVGAAGVLHLVSPLHEGGAGPLLTAAAWAQSHAPLLEAARPASLNMTHPDGPVLHVITSDAKSARPMLDTGVRVHLMLKVGDAMTVHDLN